MRVNVLGPISEFKGTITFPWPLSDADARCSFASIIYVIRIVFEEALLFLFNNVSRGNDHVQVLN